MERRWLGWAVRGVLLVVVFVAAVLSFRAGVDVTDRPGVPDTGIVSQVYYAIGLFVLGGLDLGMPVGGPLIARVVLFVCYFAAPLITTSAVIEGVLRLVGSRWLDRVNLRDHVVVVGIGRLGMTFLSALREREPDRLVLTVDQDASHTNLAQAKRHLRARFIPGDIRLAATIDSLDLHRARAVVLLTDDDLVNLEAAFAIAGRHPDLAVVAHVSDIGMQRAFSTVGEGRVRLFNGHRVAARHLYFEHLRDHFDKTHHRDPIVLGGFGRFGQTILEFLESQATTELGPVIVIDRDADARLRSYRDQVRVEHPAETHAISGDLADPAIWDRVRQLVPEDGNPPVVVLGCDHDSVNLESAMRVRVRFVDARVFARCRYESAFTEALSERYDFTMLEVEVMLRKALREEQAKWLTK
jgi:voltage-gated potassium channel Kch